jgi:hypothetical protein
MKKTPNLFERDWNGNKNFVTSTPNPLADWVFKGEGVATRKYDGTCCMFDGTAWFKRREVKAEKKVPAGFVPVTHDPNTDKVMGWVPVNAHDKWHLVAIENGADFEPGTYELCGPKVQSNPEGFEDHVMVPHAKAEILDAPRDYDSLKEWMKTLPFEGVVFHHPDGRMAKIRRKDFDI